MQLLDIFDELALRIHNLAKRIGDQHGAVHIPHRVGHLFNHIVPQLILRLVQAGGIDKDQLHLALGQNAGDAGAGGLGLVRDDGDLLPHQKV